MHCGWKQLSLRSSPYAPRGAAETGHDGARPGRRRLWLQPHRQGQLSEVLRLSLLGEVEHELVGPVQVQLHQVDDCLAHEVVPERPVVVVDLEKKYFIRLSISLILFLDVQVLMELVVN